MNTDPAHTTHPTTRPRGGAAVIIIVLLVVAAAAFAVYWFGFRSSAPTAKLAATHIPAEVDWVGGVDVKSLLASELLTSMMADQGVSLEQVKGALAGSGVALDDVANITAGGKMGPGGPTSVLAIGQGTFDAAAVKSAVEAARGAEAVGAAELPFDLSAVEVVDPSTVAIGTPELMALSAAVRAGTGKSVDDNAALKELRGAVDQGATVWMAGPVPAGGLGGLGGLGMLGGSGMGDPTHFAFSAAATDRLQVRVAVRFASGDAGAMASQIDGFLSIGKAMASGPEAEVLKSLSVSGSGQVLSASMTVPRALIEQAASGRGGFSLPF